MKRVIVLGAGISGLTAAYELLKGNIKPVVIEKNNSWGGLLDNFVIDGFRFDKFIHLSFSKINYVNNIFKKTPYFKHEPKAYNYFEGKWLKHPAQNNLYPLKDEQKELIIDGFINRRRKNISKIKNYEEWLRTQYGDYFAEKFPLVYTKKYWTIEAKELETKWVGSRMHIPSIEEVKNGCKKETLQNKYYADEMRYPKNGGYKAFLKPIVEDLNIRYNSEVKLIDADKKIVIDNNNMKYEYDYLISSLPLNSIPEIINNTPDDIIASSRKLKHTSGFIISLGFNKPSIPKHLWFYIYDKKIPVARVYSPSLKSINNVPKGCSSFQAEMYFNYEKISKFNKDEILENIIKQFIEMGLFRLDDLIVKDIRVEKYANVIFDHNIYSNRSKVLNFLEQKNIESIGRFGAWEYYWSDQSMMSGRNAGKKILRDILNDI